MFADFMQLCRECFFTALEHEVHEVIVKNNLFSRGERVAVAASGKGYSSSAPISTAAFLVFQMFEHGPLYCVDDG